MFDAWNDQVGPRLEQMVRTDATDLVGSEDKTEQSVSSGDVGLLVGRSAQKQTLPPLCDWIEAHSERIC